MRTGISVAVYLVVILSTFQAVFGQNVQNQENTVDKSFRINMRVDPVTLGMSFSLPFANYHGRAGTSTSAGISYNSKVWKMEYEGYFQEGPCCAPSFWANPQGLPTENNYSWVAAVYGENTMAGWKFDTIFPEVINELGLYDNNGDPGSIENPDVDYYIDSLRIRMPGGSTHPFRSADQVQTLPFAANYPATYFSTDGSRLKYVRHSPTEGTLYMPDGSRFDSGYFIDRHGNKIDSTDTLGRSRGSVMSGGYEPGDQTYTVYGIDGETRDYILRWRRLKNPQTNETFLSDPSQPLHQYGDYSPFGFPAPPQGPSLFGSGGATRVTPESIFNPVVLAEIELPNGANYQFRYNVYGEIDKVIHPTGAYERFEYAAVDNIDPLNDPYAQTNRGVVKHWVSKSGSGNDEILTQYSASAVNGYSTITTNPDGSRTERIVQKGRGPGIIKYGLDNASTGNVIEERVYTPSNQMIRRTLNSYIKEGPRGQYAQQTATRDSRLEKSISIVIEPTSGTSLMTMTANEYDWHGDLDYFAYMNLKRVKEYGFVTVAKSTAQNTSNTFSTFADYFNSATPVKLAETDYVYDSSYKARGILGLVSESRVLNPSNPSDVLAKTQYVYDESQYFDNSYTTTNWEDPNSNLRGNVTTTRTWVKETDTWLESHTMYDNFGNVRKVWDASGDVNKFVETQYDPLYKYAYPTKVITPAPDPSNTTGTSQTSTVETTYDFTTGLPLSVKDEFGQITKTEYDASLRPIRVYADNFTAPESQTIYGVPDSNGQYPANQRFVKVRKQIDANNWDEAITWTDGLGRTIKTQAKDSQGDVFVETVYDSFGRVERVTNPYRQGDTVYWSKTRYDEMGRAIETYAPATLANITANSLTSLGITSFDISTVPNFVGTVVTTTDASGRNGRSITNALGQLLRVDEPTAIGGSETTDLGALATPNQPTSYKYDLYGKMVEVTQGVQKRFFKYDSLGRLIRVKQPEQEVNTALNLADPFNTSGQWTAGFTYDVLGNVLTATDANGTTITNTYDRAGRVKTRSYSDSTPAVNFYYDGKGLSAPQSPNFAKGKLTKVTSSVSATEYQLFDNLGRMTQMAQITDGRTYTSKYTYNFSGALIEEEYPSGRKVKNEFESDGDISRIYGKATASATERTYANAFSYMPDGRIEKLRLGNLLWEKAKFNSRLQVTEMAIGQGVNNGNLWKLGYEYGEIDGNGNVDTAKNTGNVARQTLSFTGLTHPFVQTYKYDSLYRLTEARETSNSSQTWKQGFTYDRYGNRLTHAKFSGANQITHTAITHPAIDPTTNRFQSGQGYLFDKNGNLTTDAENRSFVFNGDNKQKEIRDASNNLVGEYFYDGEGKRIKKKAYVNGILDEETTFVYSSGKLIAEYSTKPPAPNPTTSWTVTDQLGSPRVLVNTMGQVVSRRDFLPFGEEINPIEPANLRSNTSLKYNVDGVRQKFTGYQKDDESGLDFAEARMYENRHGRFTAVDPLLASGKSASPQTFNRYVYVLNNPLVFVDPDGLQVASQSGRVYTDGNRYRIFGDDEDIDAQIWKPFEGELTYSADDGYRYYVDPNGWENLGMTFSNSLVHNAGSRFLQRFGDAINDTVLGVVKEGYNGLAMAGNASNWTLERASLFSRVELGRTPYWEHSNRTQVNAGIALQGLFVFRAGVATKGRMTAPTLSQTGTSLPGPATSLPNQVHHFATNKNQTFTPQMTAIADEFGLSLNGAWNKQALPHLGRHPTAYHNFVLDGMEKAKAGAGGNQTEFLKLFDLYVREPVIKNPELLRKSGW